VSGDLVLAAESASFTMAYTKAGLSPDGSSSYLLPRLVGLRRTQELMITNRVLSAAEALEWGLVTSVVPDADLPARLDELAARVASGARGSNSAVKKLLLSTYASTLEDQLEREAGLISECADSADGKEGIAAFLGKRKPEFSG
jgi:2-(1,2-epoxy-1,2-dihydrophenyl)acetyl-CoA isomerase